MSLVILGNTITDEEAVVQMKNEVSKPSNKRDRALLAKLFMQTYVMRRSAIAKIADGHVQLIIEDFPLLGDIFFVSYEINTKIYFAYTSVNLFHLHIKSK